MTISDFGSWLLMVETPLACERSEETGCEFVTISNTISNRVGRVCHKSFVHNLYHTSFVGNYMVISSGAVELLG